MKRGEVVTFSFDGYSKDGTPINASIIRVRHDLEWDHLLYSHSLSSLSHSHSLSFSHSHSLLSSPSSTVMNHSSVAKGIFNNIILSLLSLLFLLLLLLLTLWSETDRILDGKRRREYETVFWRVCKKIEFESFIAWDVV